MPVTLSIHSNIRDYEALVEETPDFLETLATYPQAVFVVDENVWNIYSETLLRSLPPEATIVLPINEDLKNLDTVQKLYDQLVARSAKRNLTLVSFGGGILQDITGFAASTIYRGINWIYVPTTLPAGKLIEEFKKHKSHIVLAVDEFGTVQGVATLNDVMEAIVGQLPEKELRHKPQARKREDGTWLIDAMLEIDEMKTVLGIAELPAEDEGEYQTLGGFVLQQLGHIPEEGEMLKWGNYQFEILDMDRQRIDKILVKKINPPVEQVHS